MGSREPQSLAEYLGIATVDQPEIESASFQPVSPKKFCKDILASPEFRTYLLHGLTLGTLPSAVITRMMDVAGWPKGVDKIEVKDTTEGLESRSVETLEARAVYLLELAKRVRAANQTFEDTNHHKLM